MEPPPTLCTNGYHLPYGRKLSGRLSVVRAGQLLWPRPYNAHWYAGGYYCPSGAAITVPSPSMYFCGPGYYCRAGAASPRGCPDGSYQDRPLQTACLDCPAGYYCRNNASAPTVCPSGAYCPANSTTYITCPAGTYSNVTGLQALSGCNQCPTGYFCTNGAIAGNCSAGFFCRSNSSSPTPTGPFGAIGGPCPAGSYCPAGTVLPVPCPSGTVRVQQYGSQEADCSTCPAGYQCIPGDPIPVLCQAGLYCPYNSSVGACPISTYSSALGATNATVCQSCPPGYWCQLEGQPDFTMFLVRPASTAVWCCHPTRLRCRYIPQHARCRAARATVRRVRLASTAPTARSTPLLAWHNILPNELWSAYDLSRWLLLPTAAACAHTVPRRFLLPVRQLPPCCLPQWLLLPARASYPILCPLGTVFDNSSLTFSLSRSARLAPLVHTARTRRDRVHRLYRRLRLSRQHDQRNTAQRHAGARLQVPSRLLLPDRLARGAALPRRYFWLCGWPALALRVHTVPQQDISGPARADCMQAVR